MSHRPSSPKTAVIAATLAALLAAGVGAYYQRHAKPQRVPATPAPAVAAPTAGAPAAVPAVRKRSKAQASAALMALPELRAWSAWIEKNSFGAAHGALIEYESAPRLLDGKRYWQFSFVENSPEAAHRWESFLVGADDTAILVEDNASDELLSLERWRREKHPMQRQGN